jgi:teichuronic acid biosynthesis glycosyltransferase TuaG
VPHYNAHETLGDTLQSIMRQSFQNFEVIIVDDASNSTEAQAMLEEVKQRDPRIRVLKHEVNMKLPTARNTGTARGF